MPVPSDITVLSTTPASNSPPGSETPSSIDDYLRSHASFIAQMRAVIGGTVDASIPNASATITQVVEQSQNSGTTAGTSTAYTLTPSTAIAGYSAKQTFWVTFHTASGAAPTLQISGIGTPPNLVRQYSTGAFVNIAANEIPTNHRSRVTLLSASQALVEDMPPAIDYLNSTRIDVASASTVNLTSSAPNTRHVNITGTTTITGFTVAAGQCYFVRFDNALTLTSGASLVTQTGANITTVAGDTCILRATAANTVEVLSYCRVQRLTSGAAIATTSGTAHDFTGIQSWVKKITVMLNGVSGSGTSSFRIQLGTSGGVENTGYGGSNTSSTTTTHSTAAWAGSGADLGSVNAAANQYSGNVTLCLVSGNTWTISGSVGGSNASYFWNLAGTKTLSGTLDRIRLTTVNGTDTFDAGTFNIMYEG